MELNPAAVYTLHILNYSFVITSSIVVQWIVMAVIAIITLIVTRNLKKVPGKTQSVVEILVETINGLVKANMGETYKKFAPYIGTLGIFLFFLNLTGLVGIDPSTKDINVTLALALMTFVLIQANAIKRLGLGGYLKAYLKPFAPMIIMNVIERITIPISLCLRLFCNMLVGTLVMGMVYQALGHYFAFVIPVPLHFYFDLFDGLIQMFVFMMLTMVYIRIGAEH